MQLYFNRKWTFKQKISPKLNLKILHSIWNFNWRGLNDRLTQHHTWKVLLLTLPDHYQEKNYTKIFKILIAILLFKKYINYLLGEGCLGAWVCNGAWINTFVGWPWLSVVLNTFVIDMACGGPLEFDLCATIDAGTFTTNQLTYTWC